MPRLSNEAKERLKARQSKDTKTAKETDSVIEDAVAKGVAQLDPEGSKKIQVELVKPDVQPTMRWVQNQSGSLIVITDLNMDDPEFSGCQLDDGEKVDLMMIASDAAEINRSRQLKILTSEKKSLRGDFPALAVFTSEKAMERSDYTPQPSKYLQGPPGQAVVTDPNEYDDALVLFEAMEKDRSERMIKDSVAPLGSRKTTPGFDLEKAKANRRHKGGGYARKVKA